MTAEQTTCVPNHHAHYPGFAGLTGLLAALSMIGREGDAKLVEELGGLRPEDTVLDIGCGPGTAVRRAARLGATATGDANSADAVRIIDHYGRVELPRQCNDAIQRGEITLH